MLVPRRRGLCLVVAAPSGTGKSTITRTLLDLEPELELSVSVTTRPPRPGEVDGVHYHFHDRPAFDALVTAGALLEWAEVFGRCYGTPREPVETALAAGRDVAFDIDWQGYRKLRAALPGDVVGVFVLPPSFETLENRLLSRGSDSPEQIARRLAGARTEIAHWREFDYLVVNEKLESAVADIRSILRAARLATPRQTAIAASLAGV